MQLRGCSGGVMDALKPHINHKSKIQPISLSLRLFSNLKTDKVVLSYQLWLSVCKKHNNKYTQMKKYWVDMCRDSRVKSLSSETIFDPSWHFIGSPVEVKKRAIGGMQPFGWPCGCLGEEGRRQVDIWPVCYCEFQILWLSLTHNLLEFFNLGIPETVHSQWLTSLLAHLFLTPALLT